MCGSSKGNSGNMVEWCECKLRSFTVLTGAFLAVKVAQLGIVLLAPGTFDTSTHLLLERYGVRGLPWWHKLLAWDAVYFVKNSSGEVPQFEHEWAFSMFWARLLRSGDLATLVLKGSALNVCLHYVSVWLIYALTKLTFPRFGSGVHEQLALTTAMLFVLSSAGGFLVSVYSEPIAFTLSLLGMLLRQWSIKMDVYGNLQLESWKWLAYSLTSVCFSIGMLNRSNCLLLGIYYVFDCCNLLRQRRWGAALLYPLLSGVVLFSAFGYYHYYLPFVTLCPERGEWCKNQVFNLPISYSSLYSYIQAKHWNVGFLRYWTVNNIPNFLFCLPNVAILWMSSSYFSYQYPLVTVKPTVWITRAFLAVMLLFANVQIINRVSSFIPLHLWYIADILIKKPNDIKIVKYYLIWLFIWIPTQTALFACFLPPA